MNAKNGRIRIDLSHTVEDGMTTYPGLPICEHLADLAPLPFDGFRFSAVPAPIKGMGTFPVRAYATIDPTEAS